MTFLAAVGAAVLTFAFVAGVGTAALHWLTSERDKEQNGGPDLGLFVLVLLVAVVTALTIFFATLIYP